MEIFGEAEVQTKSTAQYTITHSNFSMWTIGLVWCSEMTGLLAGTVRIIMAMCVHSAIISCMPIAHLSCAAVPPQPGAGTSI